MAQRDTKKTQATKADDRDFGVDQQHQTERTYTSTNTKRSDRGGAMPRSGEDEVDRESGVGGDNSGPGSSSGGDLDASDASIGSGMAQSGPDRDYPGGADDASTSTLGMGRAGDGGGSAPRKGQGSTVSKSVDNETIGKGAEGTANVPTERAGETPAANEIANDAAAGEDETSG